MESASLVLPADEAPVLLYDSPHSGREYPAGFRTLATGTALRRGEDAYVDELILPAVTCGVAVMCATFPRCYIDVNREPDDIDAALLAEAWPGPLRPTDRSRRGLGLIRRCVTPGVAVQAAPLTVADVCARIESVYEPYHRRLEALVDATRKRLGFVWLVDWHSMTSVGNAMTPDGEGARRPDVVVGDFDGESASPLVTELIVEGLRDLGLRVAVNDPYRGGMIVERYGHPSRGIHVVQIKVNRALYLDEEAVTKHDGFRTLQQQILAFSGMLADAARAVSQT